MNSIHPRLLLPLLLLSLTICCSSAKESHLDISGGTPNETVLPTSVGLLIDHSTLGQIWCTGAFVRDDLLLTASHCIDGATRVTVISQSEAFQGRPVSTLFRLHPEAGLNPAGNQIRWDYMTYSDVGFAIFPRGTAPADLIAQLASRKPQPGDSVQIVGYGFNRRLQGEAGKSGIRRFGTNTIHSLQGDDENIILRPTTGATGSQGDSGGPIYNSDQEIIGILSTASEQMALYANTSSFRLNSFLKREIGGMDSQEPVSKPQEQAPPPDTTSLNSYTRPSLGFIDIPTLQIPNISRAGAWTCEQLLSLGVCSSRPLAPGAWTCQDLRGMGFCS